MTEILRKTSTIFANTRGGITVRRKLEEKLWAVEVDRIHLEKMLIHLYMCLQQKAPESGELLIEAENAVLYAPESTLYRINPGRYIKVTLAAGSTAPGQAVRPRALLLSSLMRDVDPQDGMSITYAQCVVQSHGGVLMTSDGQGAPPLLRILLPASEARGVPAPSRQDAVEPGGMILLVDDDEILLEVTREILETGGYRVLTATGGRQALELFEAWRDEIDLVMLDMIMPGMGGSETFRELKKIDPGVSVIIISGYSLPDEVRELLAQGCRGFLQKPVLVHEMFRKIRQAIQRDEKATGVNP
jgi:CheY-like chemotaxis protein